MDHLVGQKQLEKDFEDMAEEWLNLLNSITPLRTLLIIKDRIEKGDLCKKER
jgi:hypothetical protein